jgi:hypothetical protein
MGLSAGLRSLKWASTAGEAARVAIGLSRRIAPRRVSVMTIL